MRIFSTFFVLLVITFAASAAIARPVCGDGRAQRQEACDGQDYRGESCESLGLGAGQLACTANCTLDSSGCGATSATCGDGVAEQFEECDGADDALCPGACSAHCACPALSPANHLEVHMIDVGQGDSLLVVSPDGFTMLVDAGDNSSVSDVTAYLAAIGIVELDYTLASHMHNDHIGGMDTVLASFPGVVACFDNGQTGTTASFDNYDTAASGRRLTVTPGETIDMGPGTVVDVLHADTGDDNENLNSVVIRLSFQNSTVLLGGDCEGPCEASFDPGHIDVYKVHHHGSSDASTEPFLALMDPYAALISSGVGNSFGHPHQETLDRLTGQETTTYRTDFDGDLLVQLDGLAFTVNGAPACSQSQLRACGSTDVGACQYGYRECVSGMWGACTGAIEPTWEDCENGVDDDCDGLTDGLDADCALGADHVVISQVAYDTPGTDSVEEFGDLYNPAASAVSRDGWRLADAAGSWSLPTGTSIDADGYLSIARDSAGFTALHGVSPDVAGLSLALGNSGDLLSLIDPSDVEADFVAWEGYVAGWDTTASTGNSIERSDPTVDSDTAADWSVTSPAAPRGGTTSQDPCGNGTCEAGEDCNSCPDDCVGRTSGRRNKRYCCGNGVCETVGEDAQVCAIDCE